MLIVEQGKTLATVFFEIPNESWQEYLIIITNNNKV